MLDNVVIYDSRGSGTCGKCMTVLSPIQTQTSWVPLPEGAVLPPHTVLRACRNCQSYNYLSEVAARVNVVANKRREDDAKRREARASMLISSGFSFDGYTITKYSGYISGDAITEVDRGIFFILGNTARAKQISGLTDALVQVRREALSRLKDAAYDLGCNAIIGVDFDYITLDSEVESALTGGTGRRLLPYIFCVTANGNAVVIEKTVPSSES